MVLNLFRGKTDGPLGPLDLMPDYGGLQREQQQGPRQMSLEETLEWARGLATRTGGEVRTRPEKELSDAGSG